MAKAARGTGGNPTPRAFATSCLAVAVTTAGFAGCAWASAGALGPSAVAPMHAGIAGFLASALLVTLRASRARGRETAAGAGKAAASTRAAPATPDAAAGDRQVRVDVPDLAEAVVKAGISRVVMPLGPGGNAAEAIALARRLSAKRASTVFVDLGAKGVAQAVGLIDPAADILTITASPTTFAHSIHRDRSSGAHVISADIGLGYASEAEIAEAAATVLTALGEAYARVVVAVPANALAAMEALVEADTAIVVPEAHAGEPAVRETLDRLERLGLGEVLVVTAAAQARHLAAA